MKKVLFLLFVVVTFEAVAQLDTIPLGERDPKYYYWDTNWWDYHYFNSPVNQISPSATIDHIGYFVHGQGSGLCKPEFARWCYTDHPLKVVGVAAVITRVFPYEVSETPAPGSYYDVLPEYLRLYEYDSTMSMVLMAEALTDTARARRAICVESWHEMRHREEHDSMIFYYEYVQIYKPIYEVYFEKPVIVTDSFYVAGTANNSYYAFSHIRTNEDSFGDVYQDSVFAKAHPETRYAFTKKEEGQPYGFPVPRSVKYRAHLIDAHNPYVVGEDLHDYDWHVFDANDFVNIFAIIDTSWTGPDTTGTSEGDDSCYAPFNLRVTEKGYTNATLLWDCSGGSEWQLAVGKNGEVSGPDQASFYDVGNKYCIVSGLDTATEYVAWVRSVCDSVTASDWSDSIVFATLSLVPPVDDTTHVDPPNPPDSLSVNTLAASPNVSIYPNPAMDEFVIESQCRIARIEIFSSKGELLRQQESTFHTLRVDVTGWAKGVYVVRVYTTGGDVIKKLIIR